MGIPLNIKTTAMEDNYSVCTYTLANMLMYPNIGKKNSIAVTVVTSVMQKSHPPCSAVVHFTEQQLEKFGARNCKVTRPS